MHDSTGGGWTTVPPPPVVHPAGAFYLFLDVSSAAQGPEGAGAAFAALMLEQHNVAVVAGDAFGTPDWIRMSYAAERSQVIEACRRVALAAESDSARAVPLPGPAQSFRTLIQP